MSTPRSFIESFVDYCEDFPTPDLFKKWAAIAALSGAVERRVWAITRNTTLIPNFIILLVAPPGIGKSRVLVEAHELWLSAGEFNVAPTTITRAAMIDQLAEKKKIKLIRNPDGSPSGKIFEYHSLLVTAPEFGVLVPKNDLEFLNTINDLYDCRTNFVERRRSLESVIEIIKPHISIIAGTQPSYLGELLPETAYGMGFTSRCLMIYQGEGPEVPIFDTTDIDRGAIRSDLVNQLKTYSNLYGQMTWKKEVKGPIQEWVSSGMLPEPQHARLLNYNTRRDLHLLKLCMISALSNHRMEIELADFKWAKFTLLEAETFMPDVFKDMMSGPDTQIIAELHQHVRMLYAKEQKPISQSRLCLFLSTRIPANRVMDIIATMVRSDLLEELPQINGLRLYKPMAPTV